MAKHQWQWTAKKEAAAAHLAIDELTDVQICKQVGIDDNTIYEWKKNEEFRARIAENAEIFRNRVLTTGIANRINRIRRLSKRWDQINGVFNARARDNSHMSVPGYDSGLLTHEQKSIGTGDLATVVDVYRVDNATLKSELEIAKQAAQELGQWEEKVKHSFDLSKLTDEELEALESIQSKLTPGS